MIVCLDSGNSRIKWGVHDGAHWLAQGAVAQDESAALARLVQDWPQVQRVMVANVAGDAALQGIQSALAPWQGLIREVRSTATQCGVTNGYTQPERLGVDRWCALIGAWSLQPGAAVVVMAGTATTVDTLDTQGNFLGGLILPGVGLMLRALAKGTAALPFAEGQHADYPRCTDDAIVSGVLEAQVGAIERACRRLGDGVACVISGGYAEQLSPHLVVAHRLAHNLPLEGMLRIAQEA